MLQDIWGGSEPVCVPDTEHETKNTCKIHWQYSSSWMSVPQGQGPIMGPLLFLVRNNDQPRSADGL